MSTARKLEVALAVNFVVLCGVLILVHVIAYAGIV